MRYMTLMASLSRHLFWLLILCTLLCINPLQSKAQTNTPTNVPFGGGSTATPPGWHPEDIVLDFSSSDNFYTITTGSQINGQGVVASGGVIAMHGNGNEYAPVMQVRIRYSANSSGTLGIEVRYGATILYTASGAYAACVQCDNAVFNLENVTLDDIAVDVIGGGSFTLHEIVIRAYVGEPTSTPEYDLVGDCPVLSSEEIAVLDPEYMQTCARCFRTPTPQSQLAIPTRVIPTVQGICEINLTPPTVTPTYSGTGTPHATLAPVACPALPVGTLTATPLPTSTPLPPTATWVSTPGYTVVMHDFDFRASSHGFTVPAGYWGTWVSGQGWTPGNCGGNCRSFVIERYFGWTIDYIEWTVKPGAQNLVSHNYAASSFGGAVVDLDLGATQNNALYEANTYYRNIGGTLNYWLINPSASNGNNAFYLVHARIRQLIPYSTPTPHPTNTPIVTNTPYFGVNTPEGSGSYNCSAPVFRDNTPIASFPDTLLQDVGYNCYRIIPAIPPGLITNSGSDATFDGVDLCVQWFEFPYIAFFDIQISLDWLLIPVLGWLLRRLLQF